MLQYRKVYDFAQTKYLTFIALEDCTVQHVRQFYSLYHTRELNNLSLSLEQHALTHRAEL